MQLLLIIILNILQMYHSWKYQTECTKSIAYNTAYYLMREQLDNSINTLELKCPKANDYLYIGTTQYGVKTQDSINNQQVSSSSSSCVLNDNDCLVSVDYLSNQCNGLNSCIIQLDSQYLHLCKNYSNYLSIAYECISKRNEINICSNDELTIESNENIFLTSLNYPDEYDNNLKCSCEIKNSHQEEEEEEVRKQLTSLAFTMYEFDVEEGEMMVSSNNPYEQCNSDKFEIIEQNILNNRLYNKTTHTLCGQLKEFKEFLTHKSNKIRVNFKTDDALTRRGFLIKINSLVDTTHADEGLLCEHGDYFTQDKCIKLINDKVTYTQAKAYCAKQNGNLFMSNDFVDQMKLNSYLRDINFDLNVPLWSHQNNKRHNLDKTLCSIKKSTQWSYESCQDKHQFICEYRRLEKYSRRPSNKPKIKIACGSAAVQQTKMSTTRTTTTTTTTSRPTTTTIISNSMIKSFLSIIDKNKQPGLMPISSSSSSTILPQISLIFNEDNNHHNDNNKSLKLLKTKEEKNNESVINTNYDLTLLIATISGISIVLIFLNIFCVWNFYNHKIKSYLHKSSCEKKNSSSSSSSSSNTTSELIYSSEKDLQTNLSDGQPHVYESIPSVHYCQTIPSNNYLLDSFNSEACLISRQGTLLPIRVSNINSNVNNTQQHQIPIIILQNGQNYCMNGISPCSSNMSTTSSQRPLTSTFGNPSEAIV